MSDLWDAEKRLWTEGADAFREVVLPLSQMLFGPLPDPLRGDAIVETVAQAPRWDEIDIKRYDMMKPPGGDGASLLTYRAKARRAGDETPYKAHCASLWAEIDDAPKLIFHQQTPIES